MTRTGRLDARRTARQRTTMLLLLTLACTPTDAERPVASAPDTAAPSDTAREDTAHEDSAASPDTAVDADGLRGTRLEPPLAPPAFAVRDTTGVTRTAADLVGHPTVLWFFREAEGST
jgi:hypothetical protein